MINSGPKLTLEKSPFDIVLFLLSSIFVLIMWLLLITMWNKLPETIPSHFSFSGVPDKWSSKSSLFLLPIITTVLYISLALLCKIPHLFNYTVKITEENAKAQYKNSITMVLCLCAETTGFMLYIFVSSICIALNQSFTLGAISTILFIGLLFSTIGYFIYKMYKLK